ncbi:unnamed protein product [Miscanthus lutarioriparius]|uniref:Uncharacterized protein n=1 Tax=Miscanthus lutarioriparius TaxID=422564 RepID=A0A811PJI9_9POAL|nr:unnamed protein product [Miscanthus lutarioriparius]
MTPGSSPFGLLPLLVCISFPIPLSSPLVPGGGRPTTRCCKMRRRISWMKGGAKLCNGADGRKLNRGDDRRPPPQDPACGRPSLQDPACGRPSLQDLGGREQGYEPASGQGRFCGDRVGHGRGCEWRAAGI